MTALGLTPPGAATERIMPPQTPANYGGSFLLERILPACCGDLEAEYHDYAKLLETPSCEITGVPLVIHPMSGNNVDAKFSPDLHHPESPRLHSHLQDLGGQALRGSRVQRTNYYAHHICEHNTFRGPYLPHDTAGKISRVLFNVAGYIPERAIFFKGPFDYSLVPLSPKLRKQMWESKMLYVERPGIVAEFVKSYLFNVSADLATKRERGALKDAQEPMEQWFAAKNILRRAAFETTDSLHRPFQEFRDRGLLPTGSVPAAPKTTWRPHRLLISALGNRDSDKTHVSRDLRALFTGEVDTSAAA
jgi:hypothetical protein